MPDTFAVQQPHRQRPDGYALLSPGMTIVDVIEKQIAARPQQWAGICGERQLTYGELGRLSDRLAAQLRRDYHVGPECLVALMVERSERMLIAMLGILKAGGAVVPIDHSHPTERIRYVLEDSQCRVVVTDIRGLTASHFGEQVRILDFEELSSHANAWTAPQIVSSNLAYVLYTSGSTGRPKGVMVEHGNIVNYCLYPRDVLKFSPRDRVFAIATIAFDISILELICSLMCGASVVVADTKTQRDPQALLAAVEQQGVTVLHLTPSHLSALLADGDVRRLAGLRVFLSGGEPLPRSLLARLQTLRPGVEIYNGYGPTESTINSAAKLLDDSDITIGRPLANQQAYVLSDDLVDLPPDEAGELCIGGKGVTRGYLNRPQLTAERFIASPFQPGERLYRTGDRVKRRPNGELEYLGRIDYQIKIRGFRVELGEIEATLEGFTALRRAVVTTRARKGGDIELVAYFEADALVPEEHLRDHARAFLPEYMVPGRFVQLQELPLTPNGKIDRQALPDPAVLRVTPGPTTDGSATLNAAAPELAVQCSSPRASKTIEETVQSVWRQLLEREDVGLDDNFFDVGGHSLLAVRLTYQLNKLLGVDVQLQQIFDHPTVRGLAAILAAPHTAENAAAPMVTHLQTVHPQAAHRHAPFPLSPLQRAYWLGSQRTFALSRIGQFYAEFEVANLDTARYENAWRTLIRHHDVLRMTVLPDGRQQVLELSTPFELKATLIKSSS